MGDTQQLNGPKRSPWASTGEPQVVSCRKLSTILKRFCERWEANRPTGTGQTGKAGGGPGQGFTGPHQYLAHETGINIRQIGRIINQETTWVGLGKADALLQAIDTGERVGQDIQVRKNPTWSQERWHEYMSSRGCA